MPNVSLSDRFFLPLAILAITALVWGALQYRPIGQDPVVTQDRFLMEGSALAQLIPGPGTEVAFDPAAPGGPVARATATSSIEVAGHLSAGVGAVVPPEFEQAVVGRTIELTVTARSIIDEHTEAAIGYYTVGIGDTGWYPREISPEGTELVLRHTIPLDAPLGNNDWIGVWPDPLGAGRTVIIERIEVVILPDEGSDSP